MNAVCRLLGISKKSYYYSQSPDERLRRRYCKLKGLIMGIIEENPSYGYRRLKKALAEMHGTLVNHKRGSCKNRIIADFLKLGFQ